MFVTEHVGLGAEYLMVIPGARSIENTMTSMVRTSLEAGEVPEEPTLSEFVGPHNFRLEATATYYF